MNPRVNRGIGFSFLLISGALGFVLFLCTDVFASEINPGRRLWDNIMLLVNFGILVFLFMRYGRKPLMKFLRGESGKIAEALNNVEVQLQKGQSRLKEEEEKFTHSEERLQKIREDIIELGLKEKQRILEEARQSSEQMIEDMKAKTAFQLESAKKTIVREMVETAVSIAQEKIKKAISAEDNEVLIDQFIVGLHRPVENKLEQSTKMRY